MDKNRTKEITIQPSTIETIDYSVYDWVNEKMNLFTTTKDGWEKVRAVWASAERSKLSKEDWENREENGALKYPLISIERKSINKDLAKKGKAVCNIPLNPDVKGGSDSIVVARRINQLKTSEFVNEDIKRQTGQINFPRKSPKIVYETMTMPMPVYIELNYEIKMKTLYQQQMNELLQPFLTKTLGINYFILKRDGHRYEGFMDADFGNDSNVGKMQQDERYYETSLKIRVLGHLMGADKNDEQPKIIIRENAVSVRVSKEQIIFGDKTLLGKDFVGNGTAVDSGPKKKR